MSGLVGASPKGKGSTDETLRQSEMAANGSVAINAVNGLKIDITHVTRKTVSQAIDSMVAADPKLAWLKDAELRGDVDWRRVDEIHQSFKYSHSGLGVAAQLVLAIALAVVTGGAGAGMVGAASGSFAAGFANAVLISIETTAASSVIGNKGNLGAALKDTVSGDSLKGYVVSGLTGGIGNSLGFDPTQLGFDWNSAGAVVLKTGVDSVVQTAINGGSLGKNFANNLLGAVIDIAGTVAANKIGNTTLTDGSPTKVAAHALLGGLKSLAMGGDFQTGALAGGANEAMVQYLAELVLPADYNPNMPGTAQGQTNLLAMSQLIGVLAAVVTGGDATIAANITATATQYNYLSHSDLERAANQLVGCGEDTRCAKGVHTSFYEKSRQQDIDAFASCGKDPVSCANTSRIVASAEADRAYLRSLADDASPEVRAMLDRLVSENDGFQTALAGVAAGHSASAISDSLVESGMSPERAKQVVAGMAAMATWGAAKANSNSVGQGSGGGNGGPKGISGSGQKMPSGLPDNLTGYANPKDIRFTQDSVKNSFSDGKVLQTTIDDLKSGKISPADLPAVRVFEKDGLVYSLDNRRVLAASAAGVPIKIVPATEAEIAKEIGRKMTTPNNGSIICVRGVCK